MSDPVAVAIHKLREAQNKYAQEAMQFPKAEPFEHGRQVGRYEGYQVALDLLYDVLSADAEADAKL